jgi:hypothetical protein
MTQYGSCDHCWHTRIDTTAGSSYQPPMTCCHCGQPYIAVTIAPTSVSAQKHGPYA